MEKRIDILRWYLTSLAEAEVPSIGYSGALRFIRKNKPEILKQFLKEFQEAFNESIDNNLDDPHNLALMQAIKKFKLDIPGV